MEPWELAKSPSELPFPRLLRGRFEGRAAIRSSISPLGPSTGHFHLEPSATNGPWPHTDDHMSRNLASQRKFRNSTETGKFLKHAQIIRDCTAREHFAGSVTTETKENPHSSGFQMNQVSATRHRPPTFNGFKALGVEQSMTKSTASFSWTIS